ncbi:MAG: TerY-C metal binding domain-containing protein [Candidatus Nanopelagicales bacterium]
MRRLPIFFLIDVSESMVGESLYQLEEALSSVVSSLRRDPYALETAFISVIAFAGKPRTITPLVELIGFYPPDLPVGGGTSLGAALGHLMDEIDRTVVKTSSDRKGDWRPIVFLVTDGHPTDDTAPSVRRWNSSFRSRANLVAISVGGQADHSVLKQLTDDVIVFYDAVPDAFARFAQWISMSIQTQSRSVSAGEDVRISLTKADSELLAPVSDSGANHPQEGVDERYAVFIGKCEKSRLPYVVKYERHQGRFETADPALRELLRSRPFALVSTVPVKNSYFDLSDGTPSGRSVNSQDLVGQPNCPHCGASYGMAVCVCGRIHCVDGGGPHVCPWCEEVGVYESSDGSEGLDIGRGRG